MADTRAEGIASYLAIPAVVTSEVETQLAEASAPVQSVFDHGAGGHVNRIFPSDYGLHFLSGESQRDYEFDTPVPPEAAGLLAIVATTAFQHTVTGPFTTGDVATFGGSVGDALLVYVGNEQLHVVGTVNVTLRPSVFDHLAGGSADSIVPSDYGLHTLSGDVQRDYEFEPSDGDENGLITVVALTAFAHTVAGTFVGGFTTATFGVAVGDAMTVYVNGGLLYVVSLVNVTLS